MIKGTVRILLTNRSLSPPGGSETYLCTVARQLRLLGHDVTLYAPELGSLAGRMQQDGFAVVDSLFGLARPDVAHVQHATTAYRVRGHFPDLPMVFVSHSSVYDIEDVPLLAAPQAVVVLNDLVGRRVANSAWEENNSSIRLRQPIEIPFDDVALPALPSTPRRALLVATRAASLVPLLTEACEILGIELHQAGNLESLSDDLIPDMMKADIVFAVGRTALEAMALGRATFLLDDRGMGGYVDGSNYERIEASPFALFDAEPLSLPGLVSRMRLYDPALGRVSRELVRKFHDARRHAVDLVEIYRTAQAADINTATSPEPLYDLLSQQAEELFRLRASERSLRWGMALAERSLEETGTQLRHSQEELHRLYATRTFRWAKPFRSMRARLSSPASSDS